MPFRASSAGVKEIMEEFLLPGSSEPRLAQPSKDLRVGYPHRLGGDGDRGIVVVGNSALAR